MLIKNEEAHLARTLPVWAQNIDYWVIGVDDNNTDSSVAVINKHLSHIPGEILIVHFDGMGPTWTEIVEHGLKRFPQASHGILADADFIPVKPLNRDELQLYCSKHIFHIWTEDHSSIRRLDWIYRNIPGAKVERRAHQILTVPAIPDSPQYISLLTWELGEQSGGYGDRTGNKAQRYIQWLEKDLVDFPEDTRTLYYLGYSHFDLFNQNLANPTEYHWNSLKKSLYYYQWRLNITDRGNDEERYFAYLKIGEIQQRFYRDHVEARRQYILAGVLDPDRADAWFQVGDSYYVSGDIRSSVPWYRRAAETKFPTRFLFHWKFLYECLSCTHYMVAVAKLAGGGFISPRDVPTLRKCMVKTRKFCPNTDKAVDAAQFGLSLEATLLKQEHRVTSLLDVALPITQLHVNSVLDNVDFKRVPQTIAADFSKHIGRLQRQIIDTPVLTCAKFRAVTQPYLTLFEQRRTFFQSAMPKKAWGVFEPSMHKLAAICRSR